MNQIISYIKNKINKINQKQKIKITMNKNMNKKIFSFTIIGIAALSLLFLTSVSTAQAAVTFQGDLPDDGINYRIEAYTAAQGSPCDAAADAGALYFSTDWGPGDSNYDDNDDYASGSFGYTSTPAHIYLCRSGDPAGTSRVYFTHTIADSNAYELDFGYITGTADVHDDLGSKYVHVCSELTGGDELSSVNAATAVDGSYSQYYYMWQGTVAADGGNIDNVYMFIDDDTASKCTFDATKKAGLYIDPDSVTPYNYGIYITDYSPGNKVSAASNLHNDINGWIRVKSDATGNPNIGLTGLIAAETYALYYDEPASDKKITAEAFKTAVDTAADVAMTISNIDYDFSALSLFRKISGTTPSDVSYVQTTLSPANTGTSVVFRTTTDSSSPKVYTLYIPDAQTPTIKFQDSGSVELFSYLYAGAVNADDVLYINKLAGSVHADLDAADTIQVFEVNDCTGTTNTKAVAVNPSGGGGTYAAYFADLDDDVDVTEDYYVKITNGSYTTCGAIFQVPLARERTGVNFDIKVDGTVHADIDRVGVDDDAANSASTSADTCSAFGNVSGGIYTMFVTDDTLGGTTGGAVDATSNVFFPTVAAKDTELLETTKDLTADKTVDVAKFTGTAANTHADLKTGVVLHKLVVYDTASDTTALSSEEVDFDGAPYNQYFEIPTGLAVNAEIQVAAGGAKAFYVYNKTVAASTAYTLEPFAKVTATVDADILGFEVQQGDLGGYIMRDKTSAPFIIYVDKTEEIADPNYDYRAYTDTAFTAKALDSSGNDAIGVAAWEVNELAGSLHADLQHTNANDDIQVYKGTDCTTTLLSSEDCITAAGATYKQYYERDGANNMMIKVTDNDGTNDYVTCYDLETNEPSAGQSTTADFTVKVSGDLGSGITTTYFDNDGTSADWEGTQTIVTATTPDSYKVYLPAGLGADWDVKFDSTAKLIVTGEDYNAAGSSTLNVGKVSGDSKAAITSFVIYTNADCSTGQVSSETVGGAGTYTQYFEGTDSTAYYVATGDGTHTSCSITDIGLSAQEATTNFDRKLSGTVPDAAVTTIDVLSVTADTGDDYWADVIAADTYAIYVDDADSTIDTTGINFKNAATGGGSTLVSTTKDLSSADGTVDASVAYGNVHADIQTTGEVDTVCYGTLPTSNADCSTQAGVVTSPAGAGTYEIFFEQISGTTAYYVQVLDGATHYSWNNFTSGSAGSRTEVELDGKLDGTVVEAYDGSTVIGGVLVEVLNDTPDAELARTYTYTDGTYKAYDNLGVNIDTQYSKASYVTQTNEAGVLNQAGVDISLVDGIKVTVNDAGGNPITYAKVDIYTCATADPSACTWVIGTCTQPSGNCTRTGADAAGNGDSGDYYFAGIATGTYIQARVSDPSLVFDTVYSPNSSDTVNSFVTSASAAINPVVVLTDPAPMGPTLTTPDNGLVTVDTTPDLAWVDLGSNEAYYEVEVDDSVDFTSIHGGSGNTADGTIVSWTVDTVLTTDTEYYWRVRACDDSSNCGDWSVVRNFYVNTGWNTMAAPTLANTAGTSQVTITWAAEVGASSYSVYRDVDSSVTTSDTKVNSGITELGMVDTVTDGSYYYAITAVDADGNESTISTISAVVTVDTTAPTITASTPQGGFYNTAQELSVTTDTASTCYYSISDVSYATMVASAGTIMVDVTNTHTATPTPGAQGLINYYVRCKDDVGSNDLLSSAILYYTYDTVVPTYSLLSVSSNGDGQTVAGVLYANSGDTVTVKLEVSEVITGVPTVSIGGENMACVLNGTLVTCTLTLSGDETLTAIIAADGAVDSADNGDTTYGDAGVNAQFDFTVPNLTTGITAPAAAAVVTNSAFTVTVNAGEAALTCKYKVQADGVGAPTFAEMGNYLADLGDNTYTGTAIVPADGTYDIYTSCQDYSGNLGTDDNQDFVVDTTGPAITGVEPDTEDYATGAQAITITSAEAINCYYAIDDLKTAVPDTGWTAFSTDQGTTSPDTAGLTPAAQGRAFYYVKCEDLNGLEMTDNIVVTWTYDNVAPTYDHTVLSTSGSSDVLLKTNDTITIAIVSSEIMGTDPTITLGGIAPDVACTETGTNYACTWTMDADFADASTPDLLVTLGEDLAGNTDTDLTEADIVTVDKSAPTLSTPVPADAATAQTSPIALSIVAGSSETGLDCRYHFAAATSTADIAFGSMGYLMSDNGSGTYGSYPYLPDGTWFVNIKCWDTAGNEGEFGDAAGAGYSFTVGTDPTTVTVTGISATKSWALADDDYDNGWAWEFEVTVPTLEDNLQMKFANWSGTGGTIAVANNMRFYSDQAASAVDADNAIDITVAGTYSVVAMTLTGDSDTTEAGRQISITVEAKIPEDSASGAYSTSYGIQTLE